MGAGSKSSVIGEYIGQIKYPKELGLKVRQKRIWMPCSKCGKCRWISIYQKQTLCFQCGNKFGKRSGEHHPWWKGGQVHTRGYIMVPIPKDDPFYSMADKRGYILEHRWMMATQVGRSLKSYELVHHKNGIKTDNRIENLELLDRNNHRGHVICPYCHKNFSIR